MAKEYITPSDVVKQLQDSRKAALFTGVATSDFQSHPSKGKPRTDWEDKVRNEITNGTEDPGDLPKFLEKPADYINRSQELGNNMFRFSFDFGRLCPNDGQFDQDLMSDYIKIIALIKARGQEPMITLNHFTMPKFLLKLDKSGNIQKGAWENPDVQKHFQFYIKNVVNFLSNEDFVNTSLKDSGINKDEKDKVQSEGLVKYFLSLNEPGIILSQGYIYGLFPPYKKGSFIALNHVLSELVNAHDFVMTEIHSGKLKDPEVGLTQNLTNWDGFLGNILDSVTNKGIISKFERDGTYSDFLSLQYYSRMTVPCFNKEGKNYGDHPEFGDMYPPGICKMLKQMNKQYPKKEIFITEFGFSDKNDQRRPYWILETINYALKAKNEGVPLKGMLLWTLVNNFEWAYGMTQKFGLFDESELKKPLKQSSSNDPVRSWEVWQTFNKALTCPTNENFQCLQKIYDRSKAQFENYKK